VILYQKEADKDYKLAICMNVHVKTNTLVCQTLKGKQIHLSLAQVKDTIGYWNRSINELKDAADKVMTFSRPYLEGIQWELLPVQSLALEDIFQVLNIEDIENRLAVTLALQSLPEENKEYTQEGNAVYQINPLMKKRLLALDLPIQGLRVNPASAMEFVRNLLESHPRFIRCGVDHL